MDKIKLVQEIGEEVCEGCGPDADCGEYPPECGRIINAIRLTDEYIEKYIAAVEAVNKQEV